MKFFNVIKIRVGKQLEFPGDKWAEALDRYVNGIETEDPAVCAWPRLVLCGPDSQVLSLRHEPDLDGFYAFGAGTDHLHDNEDLSQLHEHRGHGARPILHAFQQLLLRKSRGISLVMTDYPGNARLAIMPGSGLLLRVGHYNLPDNLSTYGARVNGLQRRAATPPVSA